jgi:hypothetical protein
MPAMKCSLVTSVLGKRTKASASLNIGEGEEGMPAMLGVAQR